MADTIRKVDYYYTTAPNKPGEGARVLGLLRNAGVNLLAFTGFPSGRRSQLDFVPADAAALVAACRAAKVKLSRRKTAFLIDGDDRVGAAADIMRKLGAAKINVTAIDAICTGGGRYGAILWVKPRDVNKAAGVLGAM